MAQRLSAVLAVLPFLMAACSTTSIGGDAADDIAEVTAEPDAMEVMVDPDAVTEPAPDIHPDPELEPDAGEAAGVVGDACYSRTQCTGVPSENRTCLISIGGWLHFPGGYCSAVCTTSEECGPQGECVTTIYADESYCLRTCTEDSDCRIHEVYECLLLTGMPRYLCLPLPM